MTPVGRQAAGALWESFFEEDDVHAGSRSTDSIDDGLAEPAIVYALLRPAIADERGIAAAETIVPDRIKRAERTVPSITATLITSWVTSMACSVV
jgi:hypothetical protein